MTIKHLYITINKAMQKLENVDLMNVAKRKYYQKQLNEAYEILNKLQKELNIEYKRRHE